MGGERATLLYVRSAGVSFMKNEFGRPIIPARWILPFWTYCKKWQSYYLPKEIENRLGGDCSQKLSWRFSIQSRERLYVKLCCAG